MWLIFLSLLHLVTLAVLIRFWFSGTPWIAVFCQLALGFYLVALWSLRSAHGGLFGLVGFAAAGPYLGPFVLFHAANGAPPIGYTALLIGSVLGGAAGFAVARFHRTRVATLAGQLVFALVAWTSAEALVEATLRHRAAEQFPRGYCIVSRSSVPAMIEYGTADEWVWGTHATLVDGVTTYNWSFHDMSFLPQVNQNFFEGNTSLSRC
jgi:hypothetical protein